MAVVMIIGEEVQRMVVAQVTMERSRGWPDCKI